MKKIIRQYLRPAVLILLALSTTHCLDRCAQTPYQDTTKIDLQWEEIPCDVSNLPTDLDLTAPVGWVCHVPGEKATYFLDTSKLCWKFTQGPNRTLICQKVADLPITFARSNSFYFWAGSPEQPALFFGYTRTDFGVESIVVVQLESGTWVEKKREQITTLFPGYTLAPNNDFVTGCTVEKDGQQQGCILLALDPPAGADVEWVCLLFNPTTMSFEKIEVDTKYKNTLVGITPFRQLISSVSVAPGTIMVGQGDSGSTSHDRYDLLAFKNGQLELLRENIPSALTVHAVTNTTSMGYRPNWQPFRMVVDDTIPVSVSMVSIVDTGDALGSDKRKFYRMNEQYELQDMAGLPAAASDLETRNTLLIPFPDYCYVIGETPSTDGAQGKPVGYRARIRLVPPPSKSN